jgi:hypothetical protein
LKTTKQEPVEHDPMFNQSVSVRKLVMPLM